MNQNPKIITNTKKILYTITIVIRFYAILRAKLQKKIDIRKSVCQIFEKKSVFCQCNGLYSVFLHVRYIIRTQAKVKIHTPSQSVL